MRQVKIIRISASETKEEIWDKERVINTLNTNYVFLTRSIVKLYERQTLDEQDDQSVKETNGVGFNKADGKRMSIYANSIMKGKGLDIDERVIARKRIVKYWNQILDIIEENSKN